MLPTISSSTSARSSPWSVTSPITVHGSSQRSHAARTSSSRSGSTTATIRSCDSEIMISQGSRPGSRSGTRSRCTSTPIPSRAISESEEASPAAPQSCSDDDEAALDELERDLDQRLAAERVADLHRGALLVGAFEVLGGEHRGAADAVAARGRAVEDEKVADALGAGREHPLGGEEPDAHRVHERVRGVGVVERALAADRRDADAVAVVRDPGDRLAEVPVGLAEAEPVEQRDRAGAHRDDVAEDPADTGRRALERLDRRRVVVRLDLESDRETVAEVDHAGVLARSLQHALAARRKPPKQTGRVLVAAVLRPEEREDGQLEVVRRALEQLADTVELPVRQAKAAMERFRDGAQGVSVSGAADDLVYARLRDRAARSHRTARRDPG